MNKLTARQLLRINQKLTNEEGDVSEMLDQIEEILRLPYHQDGKFAYVYKNAIDRACVLGSSIVRLRPFEKKNSQTAVVAVLTLLELNDVVLERYENNITELLSFLEEGDLLGSSRWVKRYQSK